MSKPFVSVIVPLFNYAHYVGDCIQSILNQDYKNFELIVVDDASTDNGAEVAFRQADGDDRVQIIVLPKNKGYSHAKNEGITASKGAVIITLDADDMMTRSSLTIRLDAMKEFHQPFVSGLAYRFKHEYSLQDCYKLRGEFKLQHWAIHAQTVAMERWIYQKYGLYDEDLRATSDKEMWWRLFGNTAWLKDGFKPGMGQGDHPKIKWHQVQHAVAYYRKHRKSMCWLKVKNRGGYNAKELMKIVWKKYEIRRKQGISAANTRMLET